MPIPSDATPPPPTARSCGICAGPASGVKSHIVPSFELKRLKPNDTKLLLFDPTKPRQPTTVADACYERWLLCAKCEGECGRLDNNAASILDTTGQWLGRIRRRLPWVIPSVDVARLTTFLVSVALRAHASTRPEFQPFDLGSDFEPARRAFESGDPFAHRFRLLAQVPLMGEYPQGFRALPLMSLGHTGVVMWFGVFRFVLGVPSRGWTSSVNARSTDCSTGGLMVSTVKLERLPELREYLRRRIADSRRLSP